MLRILTHVSSAKLVVGVVARTRIRIETVDRHVQVLPLLLWIPFLGDLVAPPLHIPCYHWLLRLFVDDVYGGNRFGIDRVMDREFLTGCRLLLLSGEKGSHGPFDETSLAPRLLFGLIWLEVIIDCLTSRLMEVGVHRDVSEFSWLVADNRLLVLSVIRIVLWELVDAEVAGS